MVMGMMMRASYKSTSAFGLEIMIPIDPKAERVVETN